MTWIDKIQNRQWSMTAVLNGMSEFLQTTTSQLYQKQPEARWRAANTWSDLSQASASRVFLPPLHVHCLLPLQIAKFYLDYGNRSFSFWLFLFIIWIYLPFYKNNQNPTKGFWSIYMNISKAILNLLIWLFFIFCGCIALLKHANCYVVQFNCFLYSLDNFILPYIFIYCLTAWK